MASRSFKSTTVRRRLGLFVLAFALTAVPGFAGSNRWTGFGPTGGGIDAVLVDPRAPSRTLVLSSGLIFASNNSGKSWQLVSHGLDGQTPRFLALDPGQPDVLYAATNYSIYRSADAGVHWRQVGKGIDFSLFWSFAVVPGAPGKPGVVFAGGDALLRSLDGGATFQQVIGPQQYPFDIIKPDPSTPGTVYAATFYQRRKSTDFGSTWIDLAEGPESDYYPLMRDLVVAPSDSRTLYETEDSGTWRSRDGGATWEGPFSTFAGNVLAVDPVDARTLYGGNSQGLFVSHDGGETWTQAKAGLPPLDLDLHFYYGGVGAFAAVLGRSGFLLAGTGRGLFATADFGAHWHAPAQKGLFANPIEGFRIDPYDPAHWILTSLDSNLESHDGGRTFAPFALPGFVLIEFDPFLSGRMWAWKSTIEETRDGLYVSLDSGRNWHRTGDFPYASLLQAVAPQVLLAAGQGGIFRSTDEGRTWKEVQTSSVPHERSLVLSFQRLVRDSRDGTIVYALAEVSDFRFGVTTGYQIYRSDNLGLTWRLWHESYHYQQTTVGFDPWQPQATYVTDEQGLRVTTDDGASFRTLNPSLTWATDLVFDRERRGVIYATGVGEVQRSRDGGLTWEDVKAGLPPLEPFHDVTSLIQDPVRSERFYATPDVGGLYQADFP
ncbi:MAG TPA: hypothetical protein VF173_23375 [Thermoanaerobaculia bacterium]|nr:hypothetical protein [Thermoanaerobaculia bacterium]